MLLINHQKDSIYGKSNGTFTFDLERSESMSLRFQSLTSRKGAQLGPQLLLNIHRNPYTGSKMTLSNLTLNGQSQGHQDFVALYLAKSLVMSNVSIKH